MSRRRGIHSKSDVAEDEKELELVCGKCESKFNIERDQLENDVIKNIKESNLYPNLSEKQYVCHNCVNIAGRTKKSFLDISMKYIIIIVFVIISAITLLYGFSLLYKEKTFAVNIHNQTQDEILFDDELYGLEELYSRQEASVWFTFAAGIKSVLKENPNKPAIFLLIYDNDADENTVKCLVNDVTKVSSKYLMKQEIQPLIINGEELNNDYYLQDPGRLLLLEDKVGSRGAMVVRNLETVHPTVASSFHFFCDRYSPLVEKAIYLFTLKLKEVPKGKLQTVAEDALKSLWAKDLPDHVLLPLVTRMTGNVIKISKDYRECTV